MKILGYNLTVLYILLLSLIVQDNWNCYNGHEVTILRMGNEILYKKIQAPARSSVLQVETQVTWHARLPRHLIVAIVAIVIYPHNQREQNRLNAVAHFSCWASDVPRIVFLVSVSFYVANETSLF